VKLASFSATAGPITPQDVAVEATTSTIPFRSPQISFDGTMIAVVWREADFSEGPYKIARYTINGTNGQLAVAAGPSPLGISGYDFDLARSDTGFMIAYQSGGKIRMQRIKADGTLDGGPTDVAVNALAPAIAWNGSTYGVAWGDILSSPPALNFHRFCPVP
jgi:hypothetical protein